MVAQLERTPSISSLPLSPLLLREKEWQSCPMTSGQPPKLILWFCFALISLHVEAEKKGFQAPLLPVQKLEAESGPSWSLVTSFPLDVLERRVCIYTKASGRRLHITS